jgi:hypothetical protein
MLSMPRIVRPDPQRFHARNLVSPLDRLLADPLSETKNWRNFCTLGAPSTEIDNRWIIRDVPAECLHGPNDTTIILSGNGVCLL